MIKNTIKEKICMDLKNGEFLENLIWQFDKLCICWILFALCFYGQNFLQAFLYQYRLFVFLAVFINLYAYFDMIVSMFVALFKFVKNISFEFDDLQPQETIDGIEKTSLVDFIFKYNGLPYKELHETFWINPKEYKKLWDNLEKNWILIRWENNARILKENIEKEIVEKVLNCWNSDDIFPLLYQNKNQIKVWL